jgi:hypothetical protein
LLWRGKAAPQQMASFTEGFRDKIVQANF